MSYVKTNWVNNTTPIDNTNLNKIEQGIYDNSVKVDIINSTLNPSGETYKLQTVTEGQITEVLGISDIKLKGNTVQDGTPTPSAPVDVNVVSGDNVIEIKSKNLININTLSNGYILGTGDISTQSPNEEMYSEFIKVKPNTAYTFKIFETTWSGFNSSNWIGIGEYSSIQNPIRNGFIQRDIMGIVTQNYYTITTTANTNYIIVSARGLASATKIQLEQNPTATSYTDYYPSKKLFLDLPVENLLNLSTVSNGYVATDGSIASQTGVYNEGYSEFIPVSPNTTYTFKLFETTWSGFNTQNWIGIGEYASNNIENFIQRDVMGIVTQNYYTFTTTNTTRYVIVSARGLPSATKAQFSKGEYNIYKPYGTAPMELCKIEDYQDYFYRDNGKWYLHKEIDRVLFDGVNYKITGKTGATANNMFATSTIPNVKKPATNSIKIPLYCEKFKAESTNVIYVGNMYGIAVRQEGNLSIGMTLEDSRNTVELLNTWVQSSNFPVYYPLEVATNTEITNTILISQLEAIYNASLYEETNITQTNNDLPIILDITAFKDNINGIKAWIRK